MNREHVLDVLASYTGSSETMQRVVAVLTEELGENWTEVVFSELMDIPDDLRQKLKHMFCYYAATMAWNEVQEYLAQTDPLNLEEMDARWPILSRWLEFFGDEGAGILDELKQKILAQQQGVEFVAPESKTEEEEPASVAPQQPDEAPGPQEEPWQPEERRIFEAGQVLDTKEIDQSAQQQAETEETKAMPEPVPDTPEAFAVRKVIAQIELLKAAQSWLAARCIELHNIEVYAYPFYGFVVDLLRQTLKTMESVQDKEKYGTLLDSLYPEGQEGFVRQIAAIQNDIALAEQNCESAMTTLISADMDMDLVRQTLGAIDESNTVEYLGPPPDGFEALDTEAPLDEAAIKEQYAKIEGKAIPPDKISGEKQGEAEPDQSEKQVADQQNASQSEKNGVQRKLSFSLKNKKPTGGTS